MTMSTRWQRGVVILEPTGKVIGDSVSELRQTMVSQTNTTYPPRILINFAKVHRMDSSGLGTLVNAYATVRKKRGHIGVVHVGKHIKNLIVRSRLIRLFEHFDTEEAAISALASRR